MARSSPLWVTLRKGELSLSRDDGRGELSLFFSITFPLTLTLRSGSGRGEFGGSEGGANLVVVEAGGGAMALVEKKLLADAA